MKTDGDERKSQGGCSDDVWPPNEMSSDSLLQFYPSCRRGQMLTTTHHYLHHLFHHRPHLDAARVTPLGPDDDAGGEISSSSSASPFPPALMSSVSVSCDRNVFRHKEKEKKERWTRKKANLTLEISDLNVT